MNDVNTAAWKVQTQTGINGLAFEEDIAIPNDIGDHDCLIAIEASSLNYRDIMIANVRSAEHPTHKSTLHKLLIHLHRAHILSHCLSPSSQAQMHLAQS